MENEGSDDFEIGLGCMLKEGAYPVMRYHAGIATDPDLSKFIEFGYLDLEEQYKRIMNFIDVQKNLFMIQCSNIYRKTYRALYPMSLELYKMLLERGSLKDDHATDIVSIDVFDHRYVVGLFTIEPNSKKFIFRKTDY